MTTTYRILCQRCGCRFYADPEAYAYRDWCAKCAPIEKAKDVAIVVIAAPAIAVAAQAFAWAVTRLHY